MAHVLVIDSDLLTLDAVESAVPDVDVIRADTIEEGLQFAQSGVADAIVLSADEPSGYSACRRLKKDDALARIPLLLVSGTATPQQFEEHRRLPTAADAYLLKPLTAAALRAALTRLLGTAPEPSELQAESADFDLFEDRAPGPPPLPVEAVGPVPRSAAPAPDGDELDVLADLVSDAEWEAAGAAFEAEHAPAASRPAPSAARPSRGPGPVEEVGDELTAALDEVTSALEAMTEKYEAARSTELQLKREVTELTERLHNQRIAGRRVEEAHSMERERLQGELEDARARIAALEAAATGPAPAGDSEADPEEIRRLQGEIRRLEMFNEDMRESLEVIRESLQVPLEIVERHLELNGRADAPEGDATEKTPIAL